MGRVINLLLKAAFIIILLLVIYTAFGKDINTMFSGIWAVIWGAISLILTLLARLVGGIANLL